ncbi:hypothetical protein EVG20_g11479 [Dentipellis fragilis]|uniref:Uncharacterized protein n=1 Tax=Dentipellis fragilis TaxID=205917 RepID=A0A4Y9XK18_9AGAM|nr:hypothetical protein EVG20_g11479 [Dentipellis fragilis]
MVNISVYKGAYLAGYAHTLNRFAGHRDHARTRSSFLTMSSWSQDYDDSTTLCSASPESSPIISSPTSTNQRRDPPSRTASLMKQKQRKGAGPREDPAVVAAYNSRAAREFYKVRSEWECYPWHARPKSRREELQKLPALCNDFESFDKQMAYLDRTVKDPGLLPQVRAVLRQRNEALKQHEEDAERQKFIERTADTDKDIQEIEHHLHQYGERVHEYRHLAHEQGQYTDKIGEVLQRCDQKGKDFDSGVDDLAMGLARPRRTVHQLGQEGRNTY